MSVGTLEAFFAGGRHVIAEPAQLGLEVRAPGHEHHDDVVQRAAVQVRADLGHAGHLGQRIFQPRRGPDQGDGVSRPDAELLRQRGPRVPGGQAHAWISGHGLIAMASPILIGDPGKACHDRPGRAAVMAPRARELVTVL
jgi:hypothetical protein